LIWLELVLWELGDCTVSVDLAAEFNAIDLKRGESCQMAIGLLLLGDYLGPMTRAVGVWVWGSGLEPRVQMMIEERLFP
jgi:hypothetical protein